ncbi:hypothetical protein TNCT_318761 [Trichonephila clavata]|uniref:Uncharacterized protein n=1 Tax=Trichonephila clavata TaxID=2740835 RepID=A0A8X6HQG8_TRICU|nr:hypothetical protein TNCT_318761 [Trichonephila clavata]
MDLKVITMYNVKTACDIVMAILNIEIHFIISYLGAPKFFNLRGMLLISFSFLVRKYRVNTMATPVNGNAILIPLLPYIVKEISKGIIANVMRQFNTARKLLRTLNRSSFFEESENGKITPQ